MLVPLMLGAVSAYGGAPSDEALASAIEAELFVFDDATWWPIGLEVHRGVVTLRGEVDTLLAPEQVPPRVLAVDGVRAVVDLLEVVPPARSDEALRDEIGLRLQAHPVTADEALAVAVHDGRVQLAGHVDSARESIVASRVVRGTPGVRALDHQVGWSVDGPRDDADIVRISGTIGSQPEGALAERLARVAGVRKVTADVVVDPTIRADHLRDAAPDVPDAEIAAAVQDAWVEDPRLRAWQPELVVDDGVVMLGGLVESFEARRAAEEDARNTYGVRQVIDRLRVTGEEPTYGRAGR